MTDGDNQPKRPRALLSRRRVLLGSFGAATAGVVGTAMMLGKVDVRIIPGRGRAREVASSSAFPKKIDVVVIGGGIVGSVAAFMLAERGISVALCEKGAIAGEASGRAMGFVYSQYEDPANSGLMARTKELWPTFAARSGIDTSYRLSGILDPLRNDDERGGAEAWLASVHGAPGFDARIITAKESKGLFPGMSTVAPVSLYTPTDGAVEPTLAAPAIAEGAQNKGAFLLQNCAVRGIETQGGRVATVVTERGAIECQSVVLAGGAWTPLLARSLGLHYDQFDMYLSMLALSPVPGPESSLSSSSYGFRKRPDGSYSFGVIDLAVPLLPTSLRNLRSLIPMAEAFGPMAHVGFSPRQFWRALSTPVRWPLDRPSPFEESRILVPSFRGAVLDAALAQLKTDFPAFEDTQIQEKWAGVLSATADGLPVISAVPSLPGLYIGSGFTNGMTYGPAAGDALAALATSDKPAIDLGNYRFSRFTDGSKLQFHS